MYAATKGHTETVTILLHQGAQINIQDNVRSYYIYNMLLAMLDVRCHYHNNIYKSEYNIKIT
jgi:hypothetical protein